MFRKNFVHIIAFLLMGCILFEDALPYFAEMGCIEMCEAKVEKGADQGKEKEAEDKDFFKAKEKIQALMSDSFFFWSYSAAHQLVSETIPPSAARCIFSPPPEQA